MIIYLLFLFFKNILIQFCKSMSYFPKESGIWGKMLWEQNYGIVAHSSAYSDNENKSEKFWSFINKW